MEMEKSGSKILKLNTGNPATFGFTLPDSIRKALLGSEERGLGYCDFRGMPDAREAICAYHRSKGISGICEDDVFIGNGVSEVVSFATLPLINPGDEVLVPTPSYSLWGNSILIAGGNLVMNAGGDGIDSNGDLTVTGGTVYLDGPTNSGNGALDYAGNAKITGGVFIALGAAGMAMNFGTDSTQGAILCGLNGNAPAGTEVSVKDSKGSVLASYTSQKSYQSILISAPGMEKGQTYTVSVGEATAEFTLDSIIYGSGSGMGGPGGMGGGPGGMGGGPGGGRPGK